MNWKNCSPSCLLRSLQQLNYNSKKVLSLSAVPFFYTNYIFFLPSAYDSAGNSLVPKVQTQILSARSLIYSAFKCINLDGIVDGPTGSTPAIFCTLPASDPGYGRPFCVCCPAVVRLPIPVPPVVLRDLFIESSAKTTAAKIKA